MQADTIYLDLETTGLRPKRDEIVQIAILGDTEDTPLLNSYVRPVNTTDWERAEAIHGISPRMVREAPTLEDLSPQIREHLRNKNVVIYNATFDQAFLQDEMIAAKDVRCCMRAAAAMLNGGRFMKLEVAAGMIGYTIENAHSALGDVLATRALWQHLISQERNMPPLVHDPELHR